jgi:hypothetical protein
MDTIPCPGCSTALEPASTVCPICTRPRGKLEITRAYATLREMEKQRKRRPFVLAVYLLAAGAAGWLVYRFHEPVIAFAVSARARAGVFIEQTLDSAVPAPRPAAAPPIESAPAPAASVSPAFSPLPEGRASKPPESGATGRAAPPPAASAAPKPPARPAHVEDLPFPPFDPTTQWAFYGRIYDVITLKPVAGAQLSVTVVGQDGRLPYGGAFAMPSDEDGRFMAVLRRLPEGSTYELRAQRAGYASPALYESDIPYATLPLPERRSIVRNAQDGDMTLPPLTDITGEGSMRRDVFLAPSR